MSSPHTQELFSDINTMQYKLLGFIRRMGWCNRKQISQYFDWSMSWVTKTVKPLMDRGLLLSESGGPAASGADSPGRGRRQECLRLNPQLLTSLGVNIGQTRTTMALVNLGGDVLVRGATIPHKELAPQQIIDLVLQEVDRLTREAPQYRPLGLGISFAGVVNNRNKVSHRFPDTHPWIDIPIAQLFEKRYKGPVEVYNDTVASLLAETRQGASLNCRDVLYLYMNEGINLGFLSNGRIHTGHHREGGEFGHICVAPDGPFCHCGVRGCLESVASPWALQRQMRELLREGVNTEFSRELSQVEMNLDSLARVADHGVPLARNLLTEAGEMIGTHLALLTGIFDPQKVVLAGVLGQGSNQGVLTAAIEDAYLRRLYPPRLRDQIFERSAFGVDVGVIGAACLVFERFIPSYPVQLISEQTDPLAMV